MRKARVVTQIVSLALFAAGVAYAPHWRAARLLFKGDPLSAGAASLALRAVVAAVVIVAASLVLTLFYGRVFCGWACPLGSVVDGLDFVLRRRPRAAKWRTLKYHLLIVIASLAAGGFAVAWLFDPLNWAARIIALPLGAHAEISAGATLLATLALLETLVGRRGFCRVLCPLGALLGALTAVTGYRFKVAKTCTQCGTCVERCRMVALANTPPKQRRAECIHCRECDTACPAQAISFRYARKPVYRAPDLARRQFLFSLAGGLAAAFGLRSLEDWLTSPATVLRPPGAVPDEQFRNQCIRCGSCLRACPTGGLRADLGHSGLPWLEAPRLSGRDGGCSFDCNACGQVCPTGAIRPLPLDQKNSLRLGLAEIDWSRCVVYARRDPCLVCHAACPVGAIQLTDSRTPLKWGGTLLVPKIVADLCIGCGLCEAACPVAGKGAVYTKPPARPTVA